ncbi:hypothetical protein ACNO5M_17370 [Vibrio owensii]|uniref:hypothetical protein n=1 Tax=Vibrio harveyi group TaxID=717610 RepID=UPI0009A9C14D|nr:hypothetical protein [Vibrio parahaemolyticus]
MSIDLFDVAVPEDKLHPLFKQVLTEPSYKKTHSILNSWGQGLLGRKGEATKFLKEFQTTFNSSFWELYLNQAFKDLGYEIDYSKASPDFNLVGHNDRKISVEAVTSNPRNIEDLSLKSIGDNFLDEATLKLAGKIRDKHKLYVGDGKKKHPYASLEHVKGNPFVLAVAPFDRSFAQTQNNTAINRVLYGLEPPTGHQSRQKTVAYIPNRNGQNVDLGIFTNDSYKEISAVIFSTTGTFGKAVVQAGTASFMRVTRLRKMGIVEFLAKEGYDKIGRSLNEVSEGYTVGSERVFEGFDVCGHDMFIYDTQYHNETHLDGLQIYHNPYALEPLNTDDFKCREVVHYYYDTETGEMLMQYNDNALVSRTTISTFA